MKKIELYNFYLCNTYLYYRNLMIIVSVSNALINFNVAYRLFSLTLINSVPPH